VGCVSKLQIGPSGGGIHKVSVTERALNERDKLWKLEKRNECVDVCLGVFKAGDAEIAAV